MVEEIIDRDAMFAMLPFQRVNSKALVYNRENTLAGADWLNPNETINEEASTFTEVTAKLRILAGDVDVDKFLIETMGDTNDQVVTQIQAKAKGVGRIFHAQVANGDATANPRAFDGLPNLVDPSMTFAAGVNGGAVTLEMLDQLKDMVKLGADALVMRAGTWRAVRTLLRAMGGNTAMHVEIENFGVPVPAFDGLPVIVNDFLAGDEDQGTSVGNTCSIYAARFNEADGLHGIYGGDSAGMRVENIGTVQNKDSYRFRMKWYAGLVLKSTQSLARLRGVTNI
ncbi:MAG: hypothetical protein LPK02_07690 [Rhodobacterales bacterium]|nr:hypothetical protein [Rhodobacterales bacterium]